MIQGHGGDIFTIATIIGCRPEDIVDFSSNMNPLGPPAALLDFLGESLNRITFLPDPGARPAIEAFAKHHDVPAGQVMAGNGTTQLIYALPQVLEISQALIVSPTYSDYADACRMHGVPYTHLFTSESCGFIPDVEEMRPAVAEADTVFICNPNNPTGRMIPADVIDHLSRELPQTRFVVDESYLPFVDETQGLSLVKTQRDNVIVLHSLSKIFRIPGLRIGFLTAARKIVERFEAFQKPWSINGLAQAAVEYLMNHADQADRFIEQTRQFVRQERAFFVKSLKQHTEITVIPSDTVFILACLPEGRTASELKSRLLRQKILIRDCSNFNGLNECYFRISLKSRESNRRLIEELIQFFPRENANSCKVKHLPDGRNGQPNDH